ncbi:hypothetical protein PanWU01x14_328450 [Parasponia andersonii]|uniref:Uncharacterized protein n=1 Tax=Parasponia andersonii TaxID=3476 RepID=A0A2P5AIS4_PARAD|nr:hypothetical protein PanWU01x14_328450 [Parasponia andersonii]
MTSNVYKEMFELISLENKSLERGIATPNEVFIDVETLKACVEPSSIDLSNHPNTDNNNNIVSSTLTPKRKPTRPPSLIWGYFTTVCDDRKNPRAKYNYCGVSCMWE